MTFPCVLIHLCVSPSRRCIKTVWVGCRPGVGRCINTVGEIVSRRYQQVCQHGRGGGLSTRYLEVYQHSLRSCRYSIGRCVEAYRGSCQHGIRRCIEAVGGGRVNTVSGGVSTQSGEHVDTVLRYMYRNVHPHGRGSCRHGI